MSKDKPTLGQRVTKWALRRVSKVVVKRIKGINPWVRAGTTIGEKLTGKKLDEEAVKFAQDKVVPRAKDAYTKAKPLAEDAAGRARETARETRERAQEATTRTKTKVRQSKMAGKVREFKNRNSGPPPPSL